MTAPGAAEPNGEQHSGGGKGLVMLVAVLAALIVGIAIGNATRKRFERLVRGR
jgi:hypothetical protein